MSARKDDLADVIIFIISESDIGNKMNRKSSLSDLGYTSDNINNLYDVLYDYYGIEKIHAREYITLTTTLSRTIEFLDENHTKNINFFTFKKEYR